MQSRRLAELTNASDVSGRRQAHELAKYEKELRETRARHAQELEKAETRRAEAVEECAAQAKVDRRSRHSCEPIGLNDHTAKKCYINIGLAKVTYW